METDKFIKRLENIKDLPTLPMIAVKVNQMLTDLRTSIDTLSDAIGRDQAIVSKILKIANSAFYGARSNVKTIDEAIVRLGFNSVRNIVVSISVFDSLVLTGGSKIVFNIDEFWKHSIAVAITSRCISEKTGLDDPDDCFIGGLLHDIGLVILAKYFPDIMGEILIKISEDRIPIAEAEKSFLKIRHTRIGEMIARKWNLPASICDTIKYHHAPSGGALNPELTAVVHMGNIVVNRFIVTSINPVRNIMNPILSGLNEKNEILLGNHFRNADEWFPDVYVLIKEAFDFFLKKRENDQL